jgi:hypothetical protein
LKFAAAFTIGIPDGLLDQENRMLVEPSPLYKYDSLHSGTPGHSEPIRMLKILPGKDNEPIQISIHHCTLTDLNQCSAVSTFDRYTVTLNLVNVPLSILFRKYYLTLLEAVLELCKISPNAMLTGE